ncbi:peptidoglycan-binding domain-containing protein [Roseovarius sp. EL26]|uniref:peptidoglycan-binding domain-containing protein n=1 Tax=Roseovarius sp. EL26 TaxID=2126672 RepID=UPI0013C46C53|nr:peptidoglycan-binding domain-containing protein [Roseovarius sp. EL26]
MAKLPRRSYLISSSDILDETRRLSVGADDMLINAINQINRSSQRYVFLDQARISGFGQLEIVTTRKKDELKPNLYIRGSISQVDTDVAEGEIGTVTASRPSSLGGLTGASYKGFRKLSVVSVDLHLVQYPSRQIVPGASVANSMVVVKRGFSGKASGIIDTLTLTVGFPISIERVESQSQAVRNLVELGVIELLGKHAGVPYWQCLDSSATNARKQEQQERSFVYGMTDNVEVTTAQSMLITLGYLAGTANGRLDVATKRAISRFQADENLLPNGILDFDLMERLDERIRERKKTRPAESAPTPQTIDATQGLRDTAKVVAPPKPVPVTAQPSKSVNVPAGQSPNCNQGKTCEGIYKNLYDFIKEDVGF